MLRRYEVKSAVAYELFGPHDLLLRVWLPSTKDSAQFQEDLADRLIPDDLIMCDPFQVSHTVRHWLFPPENGAMPRPDEAEIGRLTEERVRAIEAMRLEAADLRDLEERHLLRAFESSTETTSSDDPATKVAVVVTSEGRLTRRQHRQFEATLVDKLDEAERVSQHSLYAGWGFGHFLIMVCIKDHPLYVLTDDLLSEINAANIDHAFNARTYTHVSGLPDSVFMYESLVDDIPQNGDGALPAHPDPPRPPDRPEAKPESAVFPEVGKMFAGRYEVIRAIGKGGFASVFEVADHVEEEERRALKVYSSADPSAQVRREMSVLRQIEHPNVVRVIWADRTAHGVWYLLMELIEGDLLEDYVRGDRSLDQDQAVRVIFELLSALEEIHPDERRIAELKSGEMSAEEFAELQELQDAGFVHRDVKPSNIMLTSAGIKLLDFNIASRAGDPVKTRSGTPPYQPPDAGLDSWEVSIDLFATGVVLYELLAGTHPYEGRSPRADRSPRDPREFRPDLSPALANFLLKATAPQSADRFASAPEMTTALQEAIREATVDARAATGTFGSRIAAYRRLAGMSAAKLAERAGIEPILLEAIEVGEESPALAQAQKIAAALDMTLTRLLGSDGGE